MACPCSYVNVPGPVRCVGEEWSGWRARRKKAEGCWGALAECCVLRLAIDNGRGNRRCDVQNTAASYQ